MSEQVITDIVAGGLIGLVAVFTIWLAVATGHLRMTGIEKLAIRVPIR